ncbi:hypothetical protein GCM10022224_090550 [Nonomuraea antimicrobica]|uniref:Transposase DDE domain-containing protein n=1 Tax=Nonomuraea antimicrobica TaxID=561173 RepID=A0ABP7DWN4_9ACTN
MIVACFRTPGHANAAAAAPSAGPRRTAAATPAGMPILWALANPKIGEREVLTAMLEIDADLIAEREDILLISDKGFASKPFEKDPAEQGIELLRPSRKREKQRYGEPMLKKVQPAHRVGQRPSQRATRR